MQRLKASASCPSCGAPFELVEGANVAACPFCSLPLLFQSEKKILRYYLEPKLRQRSIPFLVDRFRKENGRSLPKRINQAKLLYLPFWRFSAQAFYTIIRQPQLSSAPSVCQEERQPGEILTKDWDINFSAHASNNLGTTTLGMRPDWLKLRLLTDKTRLKRRGCVLGLETDSSVARQRALKSLSFYLEKKRSPEDRLILRLTEERLSLIYFPLWVVNFVAPEGKFFLVIDGITKRTLKENSGHFARKLSQAEEAERFHKLKVVPHRCPNCGWDLPVTPFHVVFPCDNCERLWRLDEGGYRQIRGETAKLMEKPARAPSKSPEYHPFWVFEAKFHGATSSSVQDMCELLPSEIGLFSVKDKSKPFLFYVPAFELQNLSKIPDVGSVLVRNQPDLKKESMKEKRLRGVFICEHDAKKIAEILWLSLTSQKANLDSEHRASPKFENGRILWYPFHQDGTFLRDAVTGYSFQRVG